MWIKENLRLHKNKYECRICHNEQERGYKGEVKNRRISEKFPCGHLRINSRKTAHSCGICHYNREKNRYKNNAEIQKQKVKLWVKNNKEKRNIYCKKWKIAHPEQKSRNSIKKGKYYNNFSFLYTKILLKDPCSYCGGITTTIDHIIPVSKNGTSDYENLTASCRSCNSSKRNKSLLIFLIERNSIKN